MMNINSVVVGRRSSGKLKIHKGAKKGEKFFISLSLLLIILVFKVQSRIDDKKILLI
jgi:hypothetical protein